MRQSRLWLCVGPVAFCLLDVGLTLHGQPVEYWHGDYGTAFEGNPFFRWFLQQHPFAGLGIVVAWISVFSLAILWLPTKLARVAAFTVLFGHTLGAASWLVHALLLDYLACVAVFGLAALTWDWTGRELTR